MAPPIYATFHSFVQLVNDIITNAPGVDSQLMDDLRLRIQNSPTQLAYRTSIQAPQSVDAIRRIIGRNGCYFKMTTENFGLFFVWHSRSTNHFHLWGPNIDNLNGAIEVLNHRINNYAS
tara:strand:+ start:779 stop:1135 length:357 start_codon:yes stop_codon:yes gene_type:complete